MSQPIEDLKRSYHKWVRLAAQARKKAYAPYSKFHVGCVIVDNRGKLHSGCNVENASYPLSVCAERNAVAKMVSRGGRQIRTVVIIAASEKPVMPCGGCRQVLYEFGKNANVIGLNSRGTLFEEWKMTDLLPNAFSL